MLDFKGLVVFLMNLDTTVMAATKSFSNALGSYRVGASVLELEPALDVVMELIEEVIK